MPWNIFHYFSWAFSRTIWSDQFETQIHHMRSKYSLSFFLTEWSNHQPRHWPVSRSWNVQGCQFWAQTSGTKMLRTKMDDKKLDKTWSTLILGWEDVIISGVFWPVPGCTSKRFKLKETATMRRQFVQGSDQDYYYYYEWWKLAPYLRSLRK